MFFDYIENRKLTNNNNNKKTIHMLKTHTKRQFLRLSRLEKEDYYLKSINDQFISMMHVLIISIDLDPFFN